MKINELMKRVVSFFNRHPAYLGFSGAIIGVFLGGLISLYSLKSSKEMDLAAARKNHIEQLYLNLEFSFSLFKDGILRYYSNDWEAFYSETIYKLDGGTQDRKDFYEKRFLSNLKKIETDELLFAEHKAAFYRDYKALSLYIDLKSFDNYFSSTFDSSLLSCIDSLKKVPADTLNSYDKFQFESVNKLLVKKILEVHENSDSVLAIIHNTVSEEINR